MMGSKSWCHVLIQQRILRRVSTDAQQKEGTIESQVLD
jgi:hypothetical protein